MHKISRALLSVSDKSGLVPFAEKLAEAGVELLSTGGTARVLREAGLNVIDVAEFTNAPEVFGGRVKTLHPKVHGGLLMRVDHPEDKSEADANGIVPIDLVVVNLYPFSQTWSTGAATPQLVEQIDIGGPTMLRSAAKNHARVAVVCDPADYDTVGNHLAEGTPLSLRQRLAKKVFAHTCAYDAAIAEALSIRFAESDGDDKPSDSALPAFMAPHGESPAPLRYGENPHQTARAYATRPGGLISLTPLQGKKLSYNNLLDADAAVFSLRCLTEANPAPAAIVIKHLTPCGAARGETLESAFLAAKSGDPKSAFGGIVALSHEVDAATAAALSTLFLEVVIAPGFSDGARGVLAKKKNLRVIAYPAVTTQTERREFRSVDGGFLAQDKDRAFAIVSGGERRARVATKRQPTDDEWSALDFAFRMVAPVKSNAITLAGPSKLFASGAGQTSRVDAVELAIKKALEHGHFVEGSALGSDAFFPFPDGVEAAAAAGVKAIAQPGGSKRDDEVIAAADRLGLTMVMTGERHFRH